ncbi:Serine/threonine-protein kinase PrkC [Aquicella siphonis]|uniref:Serine/threonine-protein kinase PrkC n=1 Tax=Aquicella siphonis TaxID=254247 RepID=A0A5E4PIK5_9COXI|nr:protein kinase family protein [Aquicella siphonis]VVC76267.1 Serine/threonine-protein kinase PrkC [Aquicella siphonis]
MKPRENTAPPSQTIVPDKFLDSEGMLIPTNISKELIAQLADDHAYPDGRYKKKELEDLLSQTARPSPAAVNYDVIKLNHQFFAVFIGKDYSLGKGASGKVKYLQSLTDSSWHVVKIIPQRKISQHEFQREVHNLMKAGMGTGGFFRESPSKGGQYVIVMKHAPGISLDKLLSNENIKLKPDEWLNICRGILSALDELHQKELFHFDIKLDNYIYDPETKTVRLVDLGLATDIIEGKGHILSDSVPPNAAPECEQPIPPDRETAEVDYIVTYHSESYAAAATMLDLLGKEGVIDKEKIPDPKIRTELQTLLRSMVNADSPEARPSVKTALNTINHLLQAQQKLSQPRENRPQRTGFFTRDRMGNAKARTPDTPAPSADSNKKV